MRFPPTTREEFWDRILELSKQTDGHFSLEQIEDALSISDADKATVEGLLSANPSYDDTDAYEDAQSSVKGWRAQIINQTYVEEKHYTLEHMRKAYLNFDEEEVLKSPHTLYLMGLCENIKNINYERINALKETMYAANDEFRDLNPQDRKAIVAFNKKYSTLCVTYHDFRIGAR